MEEGEVGRDAEYAGVRLYLMHNFYVAYVT